MNYFSKLGGSEKEFPLEDRVLNITTLLAALVLTVGTVGNILQGFDLAFNIMMPLFATILYVFYYLSRVHRKTKWTRIALVTAGFIIAPFAWHYNQGVTGTSTFYFFTFVLLIISVLKRRRVALGVFFVLFVTFMGILEKIIPGFVIPYPSEQAEYYDFLFSFLITSVIFIFASILIKGAYEKEKNLYEKRNAETENQLDELALLNDEIALQNAVVNQQKEKLEELNVVNNKLFSIISHDLRSPLANLETTLQVLNLAQPDDQERKLLLNRLQRDVQNTSSLLDNLLHWAKKQRQGVEFTPTVFCADHLVEENLSFAHSRATEKQITLTNAVPKCLKVTADKDSVRLIIRNLLSNALKFTPRNGEIEIGASTDIDFAKIYVKDSGVGISEANKGKIFKNINYTKQGTENEKGSGLGLFLCRGFVEKNGGRIWFDSEEGKGTTFYFTLPVAAESV